MMSSVAFTKVSSRFENIAARVSQVDTRKDWPSSNGVAVPTFHILWKHLTVFSPRTDFRSVEPEQRNVGRVRPRAMESIRKTFYTLCKDLSIIFLSLSRLDFHSVEPTQSKTGRVRPSATGSICQHFIPSVNISVYFSLVIRLPLSRTDTKRDESCPSLSDAVALPTFYTLCKQLSLFLSEGLAIGLPLNRTDTKRDRSFLTELIHVRSYFYTLRKHRAVFFLSLSRSDFL